MIKKTSKESTQNVSTVIKKINSLDCAASTLQDSKYFDSKYFKAKGRTEEINKLCKRHKVNKKRILTIMEGGN